MRFLSDSFSCRCDQFAIFQSQDLNSRPGMLSTMIFNEPRQEASLAPTALSVTPGRQ
jgi:hypothetical protein